MCLVHDPKATQKLKKEMKGERTFYKVIGFKDIDTPVTPLQETPVVTGIFRSDRTIQGAGQDYHDGAKYNHYIINRGIHVFVTEKEAERFRDIVGKWFCFPSALYAKQMQVIAVTAHVDDLIAVGVSKFYSKLLDPEYYELFDSAVFMKVTISKKALEDAKQHAIDKKQE